MISAESYGLGSQTLVALASTVRLHSWMLPKPYQRLQGHSLLYVIGRGIPYIFGTAVVWYVPVCYIPVSFVPVRYDSLRYIPTSLRPSMFPSLKMTGC